jgi:hypothetical protein
MAFLLKIGAIRVLAEKAVPERNGVLPLYSPTDSHLPPQDLQDFGDMN